MGCLEFMASCSISGSASRHERSPSLTEHRARRFEAYGWHTQTVENGNDLKAIDRALRTAQAEKERPSLILVHTHIGYGGAVEEGSAGVAEVELMGVESDMAVVVAAQIN